MPKAENFRSIKAEDLRRVTAEGLRHVDAGDLREAAAEELAELCEAPGDPGCAGQLEAAARDRQMLNNNDFLSRSPRE
ncbi:MAG: hypothetical protein IMW93_06520 [Thermoanaerobacteraceae bacterium]|nr:hypothetical protein [Thermoanaerobacteraceae bacterium]